MCCDVGWVLDTKPRVEPLGLELLPCLLPDCQWSGRAIATLSVDGRFRDVGASSEGWQSDVPHGVHRARVTVIRSRIACASTSFVREQILGAAGLCYTPQRG